MENKWLNNENISSEDTILDYKLQLMFPENVKQYDMTDAQIKEFKRIILNVREGGSRCIQFFRDSIMIDSVMYNICLSCGDIHINDKMYYFEGEAGRELRNLKKEIIS